MACLSQCTLWREDPFDTQGVRSFMRVLDGLNAPYGARSLSTIILARKPLDGTLSQCTLWREEPFDKEDES